MKARPSVIFITATDTGVGKTVVTGLLLEWLQRGGSQVLAWKPFSSGGQEDAEFLRHLMCKGIGGDQGIPLEVINPFAFKAPITPLLAARREGLRVVIADVSNRLRGFDGRADVLLVEGAGGLLSPLGEGFSAMDLIVHWQCPVLVVAPNRLGVINHLRLTLEILRCAGVSRIVMGLIEPKASDCASEGNGALLRELLPDVPLVSIPNLTDGPMSPEIIQRSVPDLDALLRQLVGALLDPA